MTPLQKLLLTLPLALLISHAGIALASPEPLWECQGIILRTLGPTAATVGSEIHYQIHVANEGSCQIQDALLTDFIPRRTTFESATPIPSSDPSRNDAPAPTPVDQVKWDNVELLPAGSASDYEVVVKVETPAGRIMTNTVCLESPRTGRICDTLDTFVK